MSRRSDEVYVSRGGNKLAAALDCFKVDVAQCTCADLGSHVGGFVDCLLREGAKRVYAVDTCYGTLAWKLRRDPRVVALERTNAMHVSLPEPVDVVTIDVGWTPQSKILPAVASILQPSGWAVTLIKPHYEASKGLLVDGVLPDADVGNVVADVLQRLKATGWTIRNTFPSPIRGHGGNLEVFALLTRL